MENVEKIINEQKMQWFSIQEIIIRLQADSEWGGTDCFSE